MKLLVCRKKKARHYQSLFGLIVKDSMDSILKREVVNLTMQMSLFGNNISRKMITDETIRDDTGIDIMKVPEGFEEAWRVWKEEDMKDDQEF